MVVFILLIIFYFLWKRKFKRDDVISLQKWAESKNLTMDEAFFICRKNKINIVLVNNTKMAVLDDLNRAYQKLIEIDAEMDFFEKYLGLSSKLHES